MANDSEVLLILLLFKKRQLLKARKRKHKVWVRKIFTERHTKGEYHHLIQEMKFYDHEFFFKQFRMSPSRFEELYQLVAPVITKCSIRKDPICPGERLCITLRYLVTGDSYVTIASSYRVGVTTVGRIIKETCTVIWQKLLEKEYIQAPNTKEEWLEISKGFEKEWNFPNCVGAIDGKHIMLQAPARSGSSYFNYKKMHSMVLMGVCNHKYEFTLVDIRDSGRESDGSVFAASNIGHALNNNWLNLPDPTSLPNSSVVSPYVLVGDEAFPLKHNLIKPYARATLNEAKRICNYRISRARRVIENCFGILASRFRIFRRPVIASPESAKVFTKAAVALHNFLVRDDDYCTSDQTVSNSRKGQWNIENSEYTAMTAIQRISSNNYMTDAKEIRDNFCTYFNSPEGAVSWQWELIHQTTDEFDRQ